MVSAALDASRIKDHTMTQTSILALFTTSVLYAPTSTVRSARVQVKINVFSAFLVWK